MAEFRLAQFYANGRGGILQNNQEADRWLLSAATKGIAAAQNQLGAAYANVSFEIQL